MKTKTDWFLSAIILLTVTTLGWLASARAGTPVKGNAEVATSKGGAQLWTENCGMCHNIRSPGSYSPAQWEVVMLHMRVRANLTPAESKEILAFLKSGS